MIFYSIMANKILYLQMFLTLYLNYMLCVSQKKLFMKMNDDY